jgi:DNA modification methylase
MNRKPFSRDSARAPSAGDAREVLAGLPDGPAGCIVTSPPCRGKRDYGVTGQDRREPGPGSYVATLRAVLAQARSVLAGDGTGWLNPGDSCSAGGRSATGMHAYRGPHPTARRVPGIHAENLPGLPRRVASALQQDGWILRNAFVWPKPSAMPGSVRDRLNCRHELVCPRVGQSAYWFDLVELSPEVASLAAARLSQAG